MGTYTPKLFFFKPRLGARGRGQKTLFDLSLDQVDARLGKEIWVGDPQFDWHADPFARLQNAVFGLDTTLAILRIPPETYLISEPYSIPENITLVLERGAVFHLENGVTFTLNGGLTAGPYQIFAGEGMVVFGKPVEIFSEWWGLPGWSSPEGNIPAPVGSRYMKTAGTPPLYYIKNSGTDTTGWQAIGADGGGEGGASTFTELYDTPSSYTGQSGNVVRVNALGNALEFGHPDHTHANQANLDLINQNLSSAGSPAFAGLTVDGNITVSGTVAGVDVASHKTRHEAGGPDALNHQNLAGAGSHTHADLDSHLGAADNPHSVTAAQVGAIADVAAAVKDTHLDWGAGPGQVSADAIPDGATKIIPTAAQETDWDNHLSHTDNPHSVTPAQVGLGNVTDDAQLKRAAGDINSFSEKTTPASADMMLIEDSAAGFAKKKVRIGNLPSGSGGSTTFTGLLDTPGSYAGQGLKLARVNAAETDLEFTDKHFDLPPANNSCSPLVQISGTAGEDLNQWDLVYLNADGKYYLANAASSATTPALAVATSAVTADSSGSFMLLGLFRDDAQSWAMGSPLYLDTTAGGLTQTAPAGENAVAQVVGVALAPTICWINPNLRFAGWFS